MANEELIQRDLIHNPEKVLDWNFYNIGSTTIMALKKNKIIENVNTNSKGRNINRRKPDGLLVKNKIVFAVIENKDPSAFKNEKLKQEAIKQNYELSSALNAKLGIITDGRETIWINGITGEQIRNYDGTIITLNWDVNDEKVLQFLLNVESMIDEKNSVLFPTKEVDPSPLAKQVWQAVWAVSGATPENALYTFVEFFIFKYLSDLEILRNRYSFDYLINMYEHETEEDVLEYYATNVRKKIKEIFPENLKDNTTIINGTIFISKDDKAIKGYGTVFHNVLLMFEDFGKLQNIDHDFKSKLFESFLKESISKKQWGQFFTPLKIVKPIVKMADIRPGMKIVDPACGVGKFILEAILPNLENYYYLNENGELVEKITIEGFDKGFDREEQKTIILAKANMLIYFSELLKENRNILQKSNVFGDLFNRTFTLKTNSILGTLADPKIEEYDLILTNPPYVVSGSTNLKEEIEKDPELRDYYKISATGVEGLFMEWIIRALRKGGRAFVIIPDGMLLRETDKKLRQFILDETDIDGIISLPVNAFFSTPKKTYILILTKKTKRKKKQEKPIFSYIVNDIGETLDVNRFDTGKNELDDAALEFKKFELDPDLYESNVLNFKKIDLAWLIENVEDGWQIENLWSEEEQVLLGIKKQERLLTPSEFAHFIAEVSDELKTYQVEMEAIDNQLSGRSIIFEEKKITDFFEITRGDGIYTKSYINTNRGEFPVFSGGAFEPIGTVNSYNAEENTLSWSIDGLAGYVLIHNRKYAATNHRGVLIPKEDSPALNLNYAQNKLQRLFRSSKRGRLAEGGKNEYTALPPNRVKKMTISIPVTENGDIDYEVMDILGKKYLIVDEMKKYLRNIIEELESYTPNIQVNGIDYLEVELKEIVDFDNAVTNSSKFTKKFINSNKGDIPVFGASKFIDEVSYGYVKEGIEGIKYFENEITWNIDGSMAAFYRRGMFSLSEKVIPLPIKEEYQKLIDKEYLVRELNKLIIIHRFSRFNKPGKNKLEKCKIKLPIVENNIDINLQRTIVSLYSSFENTKTAFTNDLLELLNMQIE